MKIDQILFDILKQSSRNWVRYWLNEKISGMTLPGEYVEIRSPFFPGQKLKPLLDLGFSIDSISSRGIGADCYCDILLKRELK